MFSFRTVVELTTNVALRKEWDKQFPHIEVIEQFQDYSVIYWYVRKVLCCWI